MVALVTHPDQKMNNSEKKVKDREVEKESSAKETVVERKIDPQTSGVVQDINEMVPERPDASQSNDKTAPEQVEI